MSIKVIAENIVKKGSEEEFTKLAREIVEKTNALDKGCIEYGISKDNNNAQRFVMIEEWESMDALFAHMQAEHFQRIIPQISALCDPGNPPSILEKLF